MNDFQIREARWTEDAPQLRAVRQTVFVDEQQVPPELEWEDDVDAQCLHALALDTDGNAIGCGRLLADGKIGRMAVLAPWRGRGVGGALLSFLIDVARERGLAECRLDAQIHALDFYRRHGFAAEGEEFLDANIPHRRMRLSIATEAEFATLAEARAAALDVVAGAEHELEIFTRDLDPSLYDQAQLLGQMKSAVLARPRMRIRVLVRDSGAAVRRGHRLIELGRQLSSAFEFRRLHADYHDRPDAWLIADQRTLFYRPLASRYEGRIDATAAGARQLHRQFIEMWEKSEPDPELQALAL